MAASESAPTREEEEGEQLEEDRFAPSHHPSAPPDEVANQQLSHVFSLLIVFVFSNLKFYKLGF